MHGDFNRICIRAVWVRVVRAFQGSGSLPHSPSSWTFVHHDDDDGEIGCTCIVVAMAHQRNQSLGEGLTKTPHSVSLKVLRYA